MSVWLEAYDEPRVKSADPNPTSTQQTQFNLLHTVALYLPRRFTHLRLAGNMRHHELGRFRLKPE